MLPWAIRAKRHLAPVVAISPRAPTQLLNSPTYSTCRSRARLTARRSIAFNQARDFWEVTTASPGAQVEHSRRRRSLFADTFTAPTPSLACLQRAVKSVAPFFAQAHKKKASAASPPPILEHPPVVIRSKVLNLVPKVASVRRAVRSVLETDLCVKTPHRFEKPLATVERHTTAVRASRRAIAGASPQKGDTSAQVVEYIAEQKSSEKPPGRFSFSQLLDPIDSSPSRNVTEYSDLLTLPLSSLSSSERTSSENNPPILSEQPAQISPQSRRVAQTSKMGDTHSKPSAHRRGCSACSQKEQPLLDPVKPTVPKDTRLSVRAWRRDEPVVPNEMLRSSILDGDLLLTTTVSTIDRDAPSTPLFGTRKFYEVSQLNIEHTSTHMYIHRRTWIACTHVHLHIGFK